MFRLNGKSLWVALVVAAVLGAIASTLLQTRNLIEEVVATTEQATYSRNEQLVISAFKSVHSQLEKVAIDNGHWDDAVKHAHISPDQDWLQVNWGATTEQDGYVYDTSMIIDGMTGKAIAAFQKGKTLPVTTEALLGVHYEEFTKLMPADPNASGVVTGFIRTKNGLAVAALSTIVPYDAALTITTKRPNYLVLVKHLDQSFIADLAKQYLLDDLQIFAGDVIAPKGKILDVGASSLQPVATWASDDLGTSIRSKLWRSAALGHVILTMVLIGLAIASWSFLNRLHASRDTALSDARRDVLTGLHNRLALEEQLELCVNTPSRPFSLAFCDVDNFKTVNDTHGHDIGDELIVHAGRFIKSICGDDARVFRLGGDEFVILFEGENAAKQVIEFADQSVRMLDQVIQLRGRDVRFGMSIGLTSSDNEQTSFKDVLSRADEAMYAAKKFEGSMWCAYEDIANTRSLRELAERGNRRLAKWKHVEAKVS